LAAAAKLADADKADGQRPYSGDGPSHRGQAGRDVRVLAWQCALSNRSGDGSLPSAKDIGHQHGRHERWGRLVKRAWLAGALDEQTAVLPAPDILTCG
jgi:hypothetical protein